MRSGVSKLGVSFPRIEASTHAELEQTFGDLGLQVGSRTGSGVRTHDQKEWWCLRRYIFSLSAAKRLAFPVEIVKEERPDFHCIFGDSRLGIEVAEATHPRDQRAMHQLARNGGMALVGTYGGRFENGVANPERAWKADVLRRVRAKSRKIAGYRSLPSYTIQLYSNGNATVHINNWVGVFDGLRPLNKRMWTWLASRCSSLKSVGVLCREWLLMLEPDCVRYYPRRCGVEEEDRPLDEMRAGRC